MTVFLGYNQYCQRVCMFFVFFYVKEHPKAGLVLKHLRRQGNGLKSHPTGWWRPPNLQNVSSQTKLKLAHQPPETPGIKRGIVPATASLQGICRSLDWLADLLQAVYIGACI